MKVWFTSDPHFMSNKTLKRENRRFNNAEDFTAHVIDKWNSQVSSADRIYVIGDYISCGDMWEAGLCTVNRINANVILVTGNNEEKVIRTYFGENFDKFRYYCLSVGFYDVVRYALVKVDGVIYNLVHIPSEKRLDYLNLFGHVHKSCGLWKPYGFNMFLDMNDYYLYGEADLHSLLEKKKKYWDRSINLWDM